MARRRMIDPGFWGSEHNLTLSIFDRLFWIGLISNADDEGRLRGNPNYLRGIIFPYDEVSSDEVLTSLARLSEQGLILIYYDKDEKSYIQITKWLEYQRIDKPQPSKFPSADDEGMQPLYTPTNKATNDSENDSENRSENESENNSENDSRLIKGKERKEEKGKERKPLAAARGASPDYLDDLLEIFCEEYESARGMEYQVVHRGKERTALGKLQGIYAKEQRKRGREPSTAIARNDFRSYFRAALRIQDAWLHANMSPSILASKHNEIRAILHSGKAAKGGITDAEFAAIYGQGA